MAENKEKPREESLFETLSKINVNGHTEQKNGLTYLSWAWAWQEILKIDNDANFNVIETSNGNDYWSDGKTARVKVELTIKGKTRLMSLPVMDHRNRSIPVENITSFDVNKAVLRCLVKCAALFGFALYIYAGEDLPEVEQIAKNEKEAEKQKSALVKIIDEVKTSNSREEFETCLSKYFKTYQDNADFISACKEVGSKYPKAKKERA